MGSPHFDARSLWQRIEKPFFLPMSSNTTVDVCIIGAGIAGLSAAYALLQEGRQVLVIDRERLGLGETGLTSAHLSNVLDDGFSELRRLHGDKGARLAVESHGEAIDFIERVCREEDIDCEFERVDGYLFLADGQTEADLLRELESAKACGLTDARLLPQAPLTSFQTGPCLHFTRQAQFHPLKYLMGLARAIQAKGGRIHTHTEAVEMKGGHPATVLTSQGFKITCESIIVATDVPVNNRVSVHTKMAPYRSYLIAARVPSVQVQKALFWDMGDPYHYLRFVHDPEMDEQLLLVGGEDHRTGQDTHPEEHYHRLEQWLRVRLGLDPRVVARWSGQILEPIDGLAFIGHNPGAEDNVYIATGDSGHGLTHGTIAGMLLRDLIIGRENPWKDLYSPSRLHLRSLGSFLKENLTSNLPYTDWLTPGDVESTQDVRTGEGAIIRDGLDKIAAYRDASGCVHTFSAVCPHLGGLVHWNSAEKTWDCPCHGSRFDKFGEVLNGPAQTGLTPVTDPAVKESDSILSTFNSGLTPAP